jgi:gp16 family phage-associated protein
MNPLKTPQEAKLWLQAQGISVTEFSRDHDLDLATTYQVLSGKKRLPRQSP